MAYRGPRFYGMFSAQCSNLGSLYPPLVALAFASAYFATKQAQNTALYVDLDCQNSETSEGLLSVENLKDPPSCFLQTFSVLLTLLSFVEMFYVAYLMRIRGSLSVPDVLIVAPIVKAATFVSSSLGSYWFLV